MDSDRRTYFKTLGNFRVTGPEGNDLTPRSLKACGLLAILLDAPEFSRARPFLQDKLWSDRPQQQGAASLRQTLTEIRSALGDERDLLVSDRRGVTLAADRVSTDWTDVREILKAVSESREFLEDIDIKDPEFEDWLRDCRLRAEVLAEDTDFREPVAPVADSVAIQAKPLRRPQIVLSTPSRAESTTGIGDLILRAVARSVSERGAVDILWHGHNLSPSMGGRRYALEVREAKLGEKTLIQLEMSDLTSGRVGWQMSDSIDTSSRSDWEVGCARLASRATDRAVEVLGRAARSPDGPEYCAGFYQTVARAFQTRARDFEVLRQRLRDCYEQDPRGIYLAWQGFLACYAVGERRVKDVEVVSEEARELMRAAIEDDPHNSLILALTSHIHSFLLGEYAAAHEFAERSVSLERNNVLGWTFLGTSKIFLDKTADGYRCLLHAQKISGEGPYRHLVDFSTAMGATLNGDTRTAVSLAETTSSLAPDFAPSLRYLLAAHLFDRNFDAARTIIRKLRVLEPDFELRFFGEPDYPVPALRKVGLLDFKELSRLDLDQ